MYWFKGKGERKEAMTIELLVLTLLVFIASAIGTFSGFGTSTIMVPVMLLFFPLPVTLLFVGVIHWFGDIWKMVLFRSGIRQWRTVLWFAVPGFFASYLGAAMSIGERVHPKLVSIKAGAQDAILINNGPKTYWKNIR